MSDEEATECKSEVEENPEGEVANGRSYALMASESFIIRLFNVESVGSRLLMQSVGRRLLIESVCSRLFVIVATLESVLDRVVYESMGLFVELGIDRLNGCGRGEVSSIRLNVSAVRNRPPRTADVDVEGEDEYGIGRLDDPPCRCCII